MQLCISSLVIAVKANTSGKVAVVSVIGSLSMYQVKFAVLHHILALHQQQASTTTAWDRGRATTSSYLQFQPMTSQLYDFTYWRTLLVQHNVMQNVSRFLPRAAQNSTWVSLSQCTLILVNLFYAGRKISYILWNYFRISIPFNHVLIYSYFSYIVSIVLGLVTWCFKLIYSFSIILHLFCLYSVDKKARKHVPELKVLQWNLSCLNVFSSSIVPKDYETFFVIFRI